MSKYWKGNGSRQSEFECLYKKLVPKQGPSETAFGEALRSVYKLIYEQNNNGWANDVSANVVYLQHFFCQHQNPYCAKKIGELFGVSTDGSGVSDDRDKEYGEILDDAVDCLLGYGDILIRTFGSKTLRNDTR